MARKPRVVIPENTGELMQLTGSIYAQHQKLGAKSPLLILDSPTWDELGPDVQKALTAQVRIDALEKELKNLYGQRDPLLTTFTDLDRRSRDLLLAKHAANPAALGDYGFDVIEAPAPGATPRKPAKP